MSTANQPDLIELLSELAETPTTEQTVEQAVAFAAETFGTRHAGATIIRDKGRGFDTMGPTDPVVRHADELQDTLKEGPCVDAAVASRTVVSNRLADDERWPRWGPSIAGVGLGSILSAEIHSGDQRVGALNVYGPDGHEFTREDMELAHVLAQHVSVALRFARQIEGLTTALDSRTVIGQAQGILMERFAVDDQRAFSILRRLSQDRNIRLAEIARQVVRQTLDPTRPAE